MSNNYSETTDKENGTKIIKTDEFVLTLAECEAVNRFLSGGEVVE